MSFREDLEAGKKLKIIFLKESKKSTHKQNSWKAISRSMTL